MRRKHVRLISSNLTVPLRHFGKRRRTTKWWLRVRPFWKPMQQLRIFGHGCGPDGIMTVQCRLGVGCWVGPTV